MSKTSVLIPARNEPYLARTIQDIFEKASQPIEVIAVLDGYWPDPPLPVRENLITVHHTVSRGMRGSINVAAARPKSSATGTRWRRATNSPCRAGHHHHQNWLDCHQPNTPNSISWPQR